MSYVSFIKDNILEKIVNETLQVAISALREDKKSFERNVIDPWLAMFEIYGFAISSEQWRKNEKLRQAQKTLSNHIGHFHQNILGSINGWESTGASGGIDVVCHQKRIIAEIKNKHNTLKGKDKVVMYDTLENLVMPKGQKYKDYTAYYVEVIPKRSERYNNHFTPSDSQTGSKRPQNDLIRVIDGQSFYTLATGIDDAIELLFKSIPKVIKKIKPNADMHELEIICKYFDKAYR